MTQRERAAIAASTELSRHGIVAALSASEPVSPQGLTAQLGRDGWPLSGRPIADWEWWEA